MTVAERVALGMARTIADLAGRDGWAPQRVAKAIEDCRLEGGPRPWARLAHAQEDRLRSKLT